MFLQMKYRNEVVFLGKIGITTSVPVEVLIASGNIPVDLNNIFVNNADTLKQVELAEADGFPRSICTWIKGLYASVVQSNDIDTIIGVVEGDCSNTRGLIEVLAKKGVKTIPFAFPHSKDYNILDANITRLCEELGTTRCASLSIKHTLDKIRQKVAYVDLLTWKDNKVTGFENHLWQVSCSDFDSDYVTFDKRLDEFIDAAQKRVPDKKSIRLGYMGVPPIFTDIYNFIETLDARVVYNEVQRQFTMVDGIGNDDITKVYLDYTYPYDLNGRLADIQKNIQQRNLDGMIHYTQAFCYRGIEDIIVKDTLDIPVLTLEGDRPGMLDARTKLRIESFIDMLE